MKNSSNNNTPDVDPMANQNRAEKDKDKEKDKDNDKDKDKDKEKDKEKEDALSKLLHSEPRNQMKVLLNLLGKPKYGVKF